MSRLTCVLAIYACEQWRSQTRAHLGLGLGVSVWKTVGTSYFRSIAICNDAVSYTVLTSLFARLAFNTGTVRTYAEVMGQKEKKKKQTRAAPGRRL